jgi:GH15 family glucan-1,4-alpha-glucosidase
MSTLIENYGFLSNLQGSALVSKEGSIDWLCMPRFDSDAVAAALLGRDEHGSWRIQPSAHIRAIKRRYRPGTMILETDFECDGGSVRLIDFMPIQPGRHAVVRIVEGLSGEVPVLFSLAARFGYGKNVPWIAKGEGGFRLMVAPDSLILRAPVPLESDGRDIRGTFVVKKGQRVSFELSWQEAHSATPAALNTELALAQTAAWWKDWSSRSTYSGPYAEAVNSSLIALKGMIYAPTGGIVAAPTGGLPEALGGGRNWDYRFCWLRDATLTLNAFVIGGYTEEAAALRDWLLRAIAGDPDDLQIMYGLGGERRLTEFEVPWLPGYEESRPVRVGNAAHGQFQLDVFGEVVDCFQAARLHGLAADRTGVSMPTALKIMQYVADAWQRPDDGIWEVRGGRKHFTHSKLMAWVAVDRFIRYVEAFEKGNKELSELLPSYRVLRGRIHRDICERGYNEKLGSFTQAYGGEALDAALLLMPTSGFLPPNDPRVEGTIRAIEKTLLRDGLVLRYSTTETIDGLVGEEGAFLPCSFWLVNAYAVTGRVREAEKLFERLLSLRNDLGLLSEEYDPKTKRLIGNFPQAFSHLALISSAHTLAGVKQPASV